METVAGVFRVLAFVLLSALLSGLPPGARPAVAADFPSKPITLLVGFSPGGSADIQARLLADLVGKELGQRVLVENKPDMSAAIMLNFLVHQKPDGYTIATTPASSFIGHPFMPGMKLEYSYKDVTYISAFGRVLHGVSVRSDSPWKTFREFLDFAKHNPGKARYASAAPNSTLHLLMTLVARDQNIDWNFVPYNSDAPAVVAMLGGHVDAIAVASGQAPYIQSGRIRLLVVFNKKRFDAYPDVPTLEELGFRIPNLSQMTTLTGIVAPKGLTPEPFERLTAAFRKAYKDPAFVKLMNELSSPIDVLESKDYEKQIAESYAITERLYPTLIKVTP